MKREYCWIHKRWHTFRRCRWQPIGATEQPWDNPDHDVVADLRAAQTPTVSSLVNDPARIAQRVQQMTEQQQFFVAPLFPPAAPPTRRQRVGRWVRERREQLAFWIAPWVRHED